MQKKARILELLKIVAPILPAPIYWEDVNSVLLGGNEAVFAATGAMLAEAYVGKTLFELYPADMAAHIKHHNEEVMRTGKVLAQEEAIRDIATGELKYFTAIKAPLRDDSGNIIGIVGTSIDITEQKKLLDDLKRAKENAESANHAKTEFIANMSHDIRTPLSGIIGMSRFLEEKSADPEEKQYALWVNESGEQLLKLLNGVLDVISAAHLSEEDIVADCFNIRQSVEDIVHLERPTIHEKNLEFKVDIDKRIPEFIICDRFKLNRILLNLVGNAIKFTQKGFIKLSIKQISQAEKSVNLKFSVKDTGPGIPASLQSKVFEQFYRISPSYKGDHHGHGIGLHIAEKYVTLLGGQIQLESIEGEGTTFFFTIPLMIGEKKDARKDNLSTALSQKEKRLPQGSSKPHTKKELPSIPLDSSVTLLLVEDNEIALRMIEMSAEKSGCHYVSASNGEEALELAKSKNFDLIVTDIGLPGLSGNELTRKIRKWEKSLNKSPIPIIGLTAHGLTEAENESLNAGMNQVLSKPIKLPMLQSVLLQFLPELFSKSPAMESEKTSLGKDLPATTEKLFVLDPYPLLDTKEGISNLGNETILKELLETMISEEIPPTLKRLEEAYTTSDWALIEKLAHHFKSSALYCGTIRLKYACQYIERYYKAGHRELLDRLYHQLIQVIRETEEHIRHWLQQKS
ncbi:PAS domain-containing hybrid sensor histidine kinase/response regulator [Legionella drozanskii]|uniref:histidine kinase n=1 Tax=Legionella drozanskii LLAP-1 TaxID=1212489 RepID=A0A0W0SR80_9GAMM|nr:PAS domain-containing sensor histidine kinase [Legionella drozanskii]KTC85740.1 sensory box histidine kinase/response regulator [Legionella drozanskii LLAP-1]